MKLSIVIPAHNEEENIGQTISDVIAKMDKEKIDYEIVAVDDNSVDSTLKVLTELSDRCPRLRIIRRLPPKGFGRAIREGLANINGDAVAIVMGDLSDDPADIIKCFRKIEEGYDCVFGSRFMKDSNVRDYPLVKLLINRLANTFIRALFLIRANDITNAFKVYKREVINAVQPLQSLYFNITVEIPLKAIVRGFSYVQVPINWYGRKSGVSKLGIKEMGRKYMFTVLYVWLEKILLTDEISAKRDKTNR
ncbi:MAG: glycosyltransferase family 2 protein [Candidatus Omnitrophota bacterium]|nr:glycosyltransferase family 2 protein [Candidatus Omnitrophota bacterium]